jgi:hypothetical protein
MQLTCEGIMYRLALLAITVVLSSGCTLASIGPAVESFPALSGRGVVARVVADDLSVAGELLNVTTDGLVVAVQHRAGVALTDPILYMLEWSRIHSAEFEYIEIKWRGGVPTHDTRIRISNAARYPSSLSKEQLAALLQRYGQAALQLTHD